MLEVYLGSTVLMDLWEGRSACREWVFYSGSLVPMDSQKGERCFVVRWWLMGTSLWAGADVIWDYHCLGWEPL